MINNIVMTESRRAVVVVDVQADFTTAYKGSMAVAGSDQNYIEKVIKATDQLKKLGLPIYATQDWHPADHISFAANHPGKRPFQLIELADGRKQVLWPNHCVQSTGGAKVLLDKTIFAAVVRKGMNPKYDSYSGFQDDGGMKTELAKKLKAIGVQIIIVYGIATDYCVNATALDGLAAGFKVIVVQNLCRGVALDTSTTAWTEMKSKGVLLWSKLDIAKTEAL